MSGNTYVQERGKSFGIFGMDEIVRTYDESIGELLDTVVREEDGVAVVL